MRPIFAAAAARWNSTHTPRVGVGKTAQANRTSEHPILWFAESGIQLPGLQTLQHLRRKIERLRRPFGLHIGNFLIDDAASNVQL
jgi:hypothetical protein